jgi:hypothetical protein
LRKFLLDLKYAKMDEKGVQAFDKNGKEVSAFDKVFEK